MSGRPHPGLWRVGHERGKPRESLRQKALRIDVEGYQMPVSALKARYRQLRRGTDAKKRIKAAAALIRHGVTSVDGKRVSLRGAERIKP